MKIVHPIYSFLLVIGAMACSDPPQRQDTSTVVHSEPKEEKKQESKKEISKLELAADVLKTGMEMGRDAMDRKRQRDSVAIATRDKMFAYQLGVPIRTEKGVFEAYEKLSDVEGVCVLKRSRKEYLLIKLQGEDEHQLYVDLVSYKEEHGAEVIGKIEVIDLVAECGKGKRPNWASKLKKRKSAIEIDCLTCNDE
jgi:hypothetical protein